MPTKSRRSSSASRSSRSKPPTKSETFSEIADKTGLKKSQVDSVFEALSNYTELSLKKHKAFTIPGLVKISVAHKPATKARMGRNPFTGEQMMFKAKPARDVVRVRPLKVLKDMI